MINVEAIEEADRKEASLDSVDRNDIVVNRPSVDSPVSGQCIRTSRTDVRSSRQ